MYMIELVINDKANMSTNATDIIKVAMYDIVWVHLSPVNSERATSNTVPGMLMATPTPTMTIDAKIDDLFVRRP